MTSKLVPIKEKQSELLYTKSIPYVWKMPYELLADWPNQIFFKNIWFIETIRKDSRKIGYCKCFRCNFFKVILVWHVSISRYWQSIRNYVWFLQSFTFILCILDLKEYWDVPQGPQGCHLPLEWHLYISESEGTIMNSHTYKLDSVKVE